MPPKKITTPGAAL
jgi:hypothetical protein